MSSGQKGMTLVELLVALAISGIVLSVLASSILQVIRNTDANAATITAVNQIETAARWIAKDVQMAQSTDLVDGDPPVSQLTLNWTDWTDWSGTAKWDEFTSHQSSYVLSGTDLVRTYDGATRTIARHIVSIEFSLSGGVVTVNIVSAPESLTSPSERRTYHIDLRPIAEEPRR